MCYSSDYVHACPPLIVSLDCLHEPLGYSCHHFDYYKYEFQQIASFQPSEVNHSTF